MRTSTRSGPIWAASIVLVGVIGLVLSIRAAAGGHGTYSMARLFFPYTMVLGDLVGELRLGARILGLLQYPAYAIVGWGAAGPSRRTTLAWVVGLIHLGAVVGAFALRTADFP
jgi:hypothetical protein